VLSDIVDLAMVKGLAGSHCKILLSCLTARTERFCYAGEGWAWGSRDTVLHDLEQAVPELRSLLTPPDLFLSDIDRVNAYLSSAGTGTPLHFDVRTVLIVQLAGTKLWQVSMRPAVDCPHRNCVAPEAASWVDYDGFKLEIPNDFSFTVLGPGDWLLVPKATWHATCTNGGSVSASLAEPPTSAELQS
jgi:ribosomal protein L16 Arg81 hydroxylase